MGMESPPAWEKPWSSPRPNEPNWPHCNNHISFHYKYQKPKSNKSQPKKQGWERNRMTCVTGSLISIGCKHGWAQRVQQHPRMLFHSVPLCPECQLRAHIFPKASHTSERTSFFKSFSKNPRKGSTLPSLGHMPMSEPITETQGMEYSDWRVWSCAQSRSPDGGVTQNIQSPRAMLSSPKVSMCSWLTP